MSLLRINLFGVVLSLFVFFSCKEPGMAVREITAVQININDSIAEDTAINEFMAPYKNRVNTVLDSTLAYAPKTLSKNDGELNTAIGNFMADVVYEQANPIFKKRTGKKIDFVLLNHGGIRAVISKGDVSARTAYQVMPFENKIAVLELTSENVEAMVRYLIARKRAHPLSSQINITLAANYTLKKLSIHQKPLEKNRTYYVATSDYLMEGGDRMSFFLDPVSVTMIDYRIRNALIDYFKKVDTIAPVRDHRFIKMD